MDNENNIEINDEPQASSPKSITSIELDNRITTSKQKQVKFSEKISNSISSLKSTISFYSDSDDDNKSGSKKLKDYEADLEEDKKPLLTSFKDTKKIKRPILKDRSKKQNYSSINSDYIIEENRLRSNSIDSIGNKFNSSSQSIRFDNEHINQNLYINSNTFLEDLASKSNEHDDEFLSTKYESLDYDKVYNMIDFNKESATKPSHFFTRKELARWFVMFLVGIFTGLVAVVIDFLVDRISTIKYSYVAKKISECTPNECLYQPFLAWIGSNVGLSLLACLLVVFLAPASRGSGIPMVKCYLNGIKIPNIVRIKTLISKMFGVALAVSGGLACGKEGPMIHSGSIIAAGISQGFSTSMGFDLNVFKYFRSDTEKRDFVSGGAAAGVAAAFGAPVGGVLFSLEEGASFWNQQLTWRIFFGSMISTFTLNIFLSLIRGNFGDLSNPGLINFGKFQNITYKWYELPVFILMGCFAGLIGALFNYINIKLTKFRNAYIRNKIPTIVECMIVAAVSAVVGFMLSFYFNNDCQPIGRDLVSKYPVQLFCDDGQYNALSGLFFQTPEKSVKSLFHDPPGSFNPVTLAVFCVAYYFLAVWTYGLAIPSGLFIPSLLIGAAWGRLFGIGINTLFPASNVDPGKYALIGAASTLGGILRMTLSLTVIVTEATGDISLGLPIMFSMMSAKIFGDFFNEGIFDMHIQLSGIPLLDWDPPAMTTALCAQHVMSHPVVVLREKERVSRIVDILRKSKHNGFPVVSGYDPDDGRVADSFGQLKGLILRHQLLTLLKKRTYLFDSAELSPDDFREFYPRYLTLEDIEINDNDLDFELDLRPYMNLAPYSLTENSNLPKIFRLFRGLGLRHLVIVNDTNCVTGIVTRIDIAKYKSHVGFLHASIKELNITA